MPSPSPGRSGRSAGARGARGAREDLERARHLLRDSADPEDVSRARRLVANAQRSLFPTAGERAVRDRQAAAADPRLGEDAAGPVRRRRARLARDLEPLLAQQRERRRAGYVDEGPVGRSLGELPFDDGHLHLRAGPVDVYVHRIHFVALSRVDAQCE